MHKKVILASGSPRRSDLLSCAGVRFDVVLPDIDEKPIRGESPRDMVKRLAKGKAEEVAGKGGARSGPRLIIAADTTVVCPKGKILGKPQNDREAISMVFSLQGRVHKVLTGYAIQLADRGRVIKSLVRVVETRVKIRKMSMTEVREYVSRGESLDKAGAYAAQGAGMVMIEAISGSYTNVVGLPMSQVLEDLKEFGWKP